MVNNNMGLHILLISLIVSTTVLSTNVVPVQPKTVNWHLIVGHKTGHTKMYLNDNGIETSDIGGHTFTSGAILIVSDEDRVIVIKDTPIPFKSIVRHVLVDCKRRIMLPLINYYFDIESPVAADKPVASYEYVQDSKTIEPLKNHSIIYETLCPNYI